MKTLIKTIAGADCEIFAVKHHQRFRVGSATPTVEIYQNSTQMPVLGQPGGQIKTYEFSLIICPNPELDSLLHEGLLDETTIFDLKMLLQREDEVFIPFELAGLTEFSISTLGKWEFFVNDPTVTKALLTL